MARLIRLQLVVLLGAVVVGVVTFLLVRGIPAPATTLRVAVSPATEPWLRPVLEAYRADGVSVSIDVVESRIAADRWRNGWDRTPTIWIADDRYAIEAAGDRLGPAETIARTPLVWAVWESRDRALGAPLDWNVAHDAPRNWSALGQPAWGTRKVAIPLDDPNVLASAADSFFGRPVTGPDLADPAFRRWLRETAKVAVNVDAGQLVALGLSVADGGLFTDQDLSRAGRPNELIARPVVPTRSREVGFAVAAASPAEQRAAAALLAYLVSNDVQDRTRDAGLRPAGAPSAMMSPRWADLNALVAWLAAG